MKKTIKLKKNYEFNNTFKRGKYFSGKYIESFYIKNNKNINYIGIAISSKQCNAVKRNRVKRLIREAYRCLEYDINIGNTVVFLLKKNISVEECNYNNILEDMKKIMINIIRFYKKHISIFFEKSGVKCKFYPTCSEYAIQAYEKYGVIKGTFLSIKRILRCNPFSKGGYDPLK